MDLGNYKILVLLIAVIGKEAESSRPKVAVPHCTVIPEHFLHGYVIFSS